LEDLFAKYLAVKVCQLIIDPMDDAAVDCAVGKFQNAPPGQLSKPQGSWWREGDVAAESMALEAFADALTHGLKCDLAARQGGLYRRGEELVRWTRRGLDGFWKMALTLGLSIGMSDSQAIIAACSVSNVTWLLDSGGWQDYLSASPDRNAVPHSLTRMWLCPLPKDYTDLVSSVQQGLCDKCKLQRHDSAVCLICGEILTLAPCSVDVVTRQGAATIHNQRHHLNVGVIFALHRRVLILMHRRKTAYWPSLYVDKYGEDNSHTNRGLPLYLDVKRWEKLQNLWATNGIPKEVARYRGLATRVDPEGSM